MAADPLFDLDGRVAVITGSSSGLGAHFARVLHSRGMRVVLAGRRADRLHSLAAELGATALAVPTDVTAEGSAAALVERTLAAHGRIDVLINNAGIAEGGIHAETEALSTFDRVIDVNLAAVFACCQAAAGPMLAAGAGSIVNIASIAGFGSLSDRYPMAGYVSAKHGVVGLTRELGAQWASRGVRVNAIAPGFAPPR